MDEAEFLKTCEQVKVKQAEIKSQREKNSPTRITPPAEQSLSARHNDEAYQAKLAKDLRYERQQKAGKIQAALKASIPFIFWGAKLSLLNREFIARLLDFDASIGLVLCGPTGTGKSHTLAALMRRFIASGQKCERIGWEMLCIKIRATYSKDSTETEDSILKRLLLPRHLFIEDIGAGKAVDTPETDFAKRILYVLIDTRLENGLPTYITTNRTREQLAATFDERIASRLSAFKWIAIGGKDKRMKAK